MPMPNEHSRREQEKRDYFTKLDNHNREMFKQGQDRFWEKSDGIIKGSTPPKGGSNTSSHGITTTSGSSGLGRLLKYIILGAIALWLWSSFHNGSTSNSAPDNPVTSRSQPSHH